MARSTVKTETILDQLVEGKREALVAQMAAEPLADLESRARSSPLPLPLQPRLRGGEVKLIAEIKRASPTAGILGASFDLGARALSYMAGGAAAISILTEERQFLGRLEDLTGVRQALESDARHARLPLLRKDFLFEPYHLYEARAAGADAVLLIVAVLEQRVLEELLGLANALGLSTIVEVHDEVEVGRAIDAKAEIVGINNRDLRTFVTRLDVTERLLPLIPARTTVVSESGIRDRGDIERLAALDVDAALVGEALMLSGDIENTVRNLATVPRHPSSGFEVTGGAADRGAYYRSSSDTR